MKRVVLVLFSQMVAMVSTLDILRTSPETDMKMLLDFKAQVTIDPYKRLSSWFDDEKGYSCSWSGVTCSKGKRVSALSLPNLGLQGVLSPALGSLPYLTYLNLSLNQFSGQIPDEIGNLSLLKHMDLSNNKLRGSIRSAVFNRLAILLKLNLNSNELSGSFPEGLANCKELYYLSISKNRVSGNGSLSTLSKLKNLRWAYLNENKLGGALPSEIKSLDRIEVFDLHGNYFSGTLPKEMGSLKRLKILNLAKNDLEGPLPSELSAGIRISELRLNDNAFTGPIPATIGLMGNLTVLDLSDNRISQSIPTSIGSCAMLRELNLRNNYIMGRVPSSIGALLSLDFRLDLSHNILEGYIPPQIGNLAALLSVDLSFNMFTGDIPASLGSCVTLRWLDLSNNNLRGSLPSSFGNLGALYYLDLSHNNLSGTIPTELGQLENLESLDLSVNRLTGMIPPVIGSLNLSHFNVSYNMLVGPVPNTDTFLKFPRSAFKNNTGFCGWVTNTACSKTPDFYKAVKGGVNSALLAVACLVVAIILSFGLGSLVFMIKYLGSCPSSAAVMQGSFRKFSKDALVAATEGFSDANLLGVGNRFKVFKGNIDGMVVVVKVLRHELLQGFQSQFSIECETLARAQHPNLLRLLGWCSCPHLLAVVLPFMQNGSLEKQLHQVEGACALVWDIRLRIAEGVANGLAFIHQTWQVKPLLQCNLKASGIQLDDEFNPYISNLSMGLPSSGTRPGYMAPG